MIIDNVNLSLLKIYVLHVLLDHEICQKLIGIVIYRQLLNFHSFLI